MKKFEIPYKYLDFTKSVYTRSAPFGLSEYLS